MKSNYPNHVALIIDSQTRAGAQLQTAMLAKELVRARCRVSLLLLEHPSDLPLPEISGVEIISTPVTALNSKQAIKDLFGLVESLRSLAPDVVHTFLFKANLVGTLAARMAGVPVVVGSRRSLGYDLTPSRVLLSRLFNRLTDGVVVNAKAIIRSGGNADSRSLPVPVVIPNGVETPPVSMGSKTGSGKKIGVLGNVRPIKGHDVALKAFSRVIEEMPDAELHLMGDRNSDPKWDQIISQMIVDLDLAGKVSWHAPDGSINSFFSQLDLLVSASHSEGMPNAVLEGMAAGLPVVATDAGGTAEVMGSAGIVVPTGNIDELAAGILEMLRNEKDRSIAGEICRSRVIDRFKPAQLAKRHLEYYSWLGETRTKRGPGLPFFRPRRTVLIAIDILDTGGTERQVDHWARGLMKQGISVQIICLRAGGRVADKLAADGIKVHVLGKKKRLDLGFLIRQQLLIMKIRPMTVLALLTTAGIWTVPASRFSGVPRVLFSMRAMALTDDPASHGPVSLLSFALKFAHQVIGNSQQVLDFCRQNLGVMADQTTILPNAISGMELREVKKLDMRKEKDLPMEGRLIGIVARLVPVKDHSLFLETCAILKKYLPQTKAIIVGDGPLREELEKEANSLGLMDNVIFLGHRKDSLEVIRALDALVMTSKSEGSPNAVLEAMTVGTPVVSVDVGDVASMAEDGDIFVTKDRSAENLAQALKNTLLSPKAPEDLDNQDVNSHDPGHVSQLLRSLVGNRLEVPVILNKGATS